MFSSSCWVICVAAEEEEGGDFGGPGLVEGMLGSVFSGSDGEGPDCLCSRASLANWNVWVHGVQEDPRRSLSCQLTKELSSSVQPPPIPSSSS